MKSIHMRFLAAAFAIILGVAMAQAQGPDMGMHHGGFGGEHMIGFMADYLNLTDAQQKQMHDTMTREHATLKPLMQQLHETRTQLKQYETGTYDEAKVRALATQQAQVQTELTVQQTRIHNEIFQILTPDQQSKMKDLMAKHQERMAEHMQHHLQQPPAQPEQ